MSREKKRTMAKASDLGAAVVWEKSPPPDWGRYWTRLADGTVVQQSWAWEGWTDTRSDRNTMWARMEFVLVMGKRRDATEAVLGQGPGQIREDGGRKPEGQLPCQARRAPSIPLLLEVADA